MVDAERIHRSIGERRSSRTPDGVDERFGPYRILAPLGRGGMGEVHEAYDTVRERTVALKRLHEGNAADESAQERFRREARIAGRLDSPHIVPIHDFGLIDGRSFIDMRLVRGRDLGALINAEGPLAPERAVAIVMQLADALDAAHEAGVVHRDVKPSNALLTRPRDRDFAYLTDFGIVHVADAVRPDRLTATGSTIGTPPYMAPEYICGRTFDHRLDVYALGCVLFEMLTGRAPFVGSPVAVMYAHVHEQPPEPTRTRPDLGPAFSGDLDAVIQRALAKDPGERYSSAGELGATVHRALSEADRARRPILVAPRQRTGNPLSGPNSVGTTPPAPGREQSDTATPTRGRPRRALLLAVALVVLTGAVVVGLHALMHSPVVAKDVVEEQIVAQTGLSPAQVSCPVDLPARIGESVTCTATSGALSQVIRATVTSVVDHQVDFDLSTAGPTG